MLPYVTAGQVIAAAARAVLRAERRCHRSGNATDIHGSKSFQLRGTSDGITGLIPQARRVLQAPPAAPYKYKRAHGTDREGWRLAAREIEEAVIRILADALTSPASLVERFGAAGMPSDQVRKLLSRAARMAAALGGSPGERVKLVRELVEKIIVDEKTLTIKLRRGLLLGGDVPSSATEAASEGAVELTAAVAFTRRGAETKLVLPGLAPQTHSSKCDPALIKAIARGHAWFEELATNRARSLQVLAKRDGSSLHSPSH